MISSMLFLARADKAVQVIRRETVMTETLFSQLREFFEIAAEERNIELAFSGNVPLSADILPIRHTPYAIRHTPYAIRHTPYAI